MNNLKNFIFTRPHLENNPSDEQFSTAYQRSPKNVQAAVDNFLLNIKISCNDHEPTVITWRKRIGMSLEKLTDNDDSNGVNSINALNELKTEFLVLYLGKRQYKDLLSYWLITMLLAFIVSLLLGENGILRKTALYDQMISAPFYGHFSEYISFRYALYGVLIGNALLFSYRQSVPKFDELIIKRSILERPLLNLIIGCVLAYILSRLIAENQFSLDVLGFKIKQDFDSNKNPGFRNSGALFLIGLAACIAADIYLQRLIDGTRKSAQKAFE